MFVLLNHHLEIIERAYMLQSSFPVTFEHWKTERKSRKLLQTGVDKLQFKLKPTGGTKNVPLIIAMTTDAH